MIIALVVLWWLAGFTGHLYLDFRFNPQPLTWGGLTTALVIGLFGGPLWWIVALFTADFWSRPVFRKTKRTYVSTNLNPLTGLPDTYERNRAE